MLGTTGVFLWQSVRTESDIFSVGKAALGCRSDLSHYQMVTQLDKLPFTESYFLNYPQLGEASSSFDFSVYCTTRAASRPIGI